MISLQAIAFLAALGGSSLGAAWDLKTTEIPDEISYVMAAIGIVVNVALSASTGSIWPIATSLIAGAGLFAFGFFMYYFGQWGGGDAKLLSAVGFLLPSIAGVGSSMMLFFPFPVSYLFNVFFVGAIYMMVYAAAMAARNGRIVASFISDVRANSKVLLPASVILFLVFVGVNYLLYRQLDIPLDQVAIVGNSAFVLALTAGLYCVWKFAKAVETVGFVRRIPLRLLKVGDVLQESKVWEGLTERELKNIKKSGRRFVTVKEGVRFAPAFPLALLFTFFFGDAILILIRIAA
jgi:Flp pilus assembly protein protease CpaA